MWRDEPRDRNLAYEDEAGANTGSLTASGTRVSTAAWVVNQEREVARRRTREGLAAAKACGKALRRRRSLNDEQVQLAKRMKGAGASGRKIA